MSEFSLIYEHFKHATRRHRLTKIGIGDDCAISDLPINRQLVSCVDVLVAGRHFPHSTRPYAIGYKAVAVNLSDLAAMGATPYAILLGLSLPSQLACDEWLQPFTQGMADICGQFKVELIGGDTTKSDVLTISVTALGFVPEGKAILRSGAKVGDKICVSGKIGSASYALSQVLQGGASSLQQALDLPMPQVTLGQTLLGYANAMIDISDGLGQDLGHLLEASGVGARLYLEQIPTAMPLNNLSNAQRWHHQLNGGDDYQLCFTLSATSFENFSRMNLGRIFPIGDIVAEKGLQLLYDGQRVDFNIQGYQHF